MKNIIDIFIQLPKQHRVIMSSFGIIILFALLIPSKPVLEKNSNLTIGKRYPLPISVAPSSNKFAPTELATIAPPSNATPDSLVVGKASSSDVFAKLNWQIAKVRGGDSLARIFKRLGFSAQTTYAVSAAQGESSQLLKKLDVGDTLHIGSDHNKQLTALAYPISKTDTLYIELIDGSYQSRKESKTLDIRQSFSHGIITSSFWNAGVASGLSDGQIISFANIFGWDIDFAQDIRQGDSFHVIFEKQYIEGEYIGTGNILAAEFINQGEVFQAVRFSDGEYYTPQGKSMRKAFLRAPVNFKYISSRFNPRRKHPVTGRVKAHKGIDYAAKTGTPVVSAGNGKVIKSGYSRFNGNFVFVQHGSKYVTKYLHLHKRKVKRGQKVKQGQLIGTVGATGQVTGAHLHYEFLVNGVHRNPRTVKLPDAKNIAKKYQAEFTLVSARRLKELSGSKNALLSMKGMAIEEPNTDDLVNTADE